jgi:hypothetical protein
MHTAAERGKHDAGTADDCEWSVCGSQRGLGCRKAVVVPLVQAFCMHVRRCSARLDVVGSLQLYRRNGKIWARRVRAATSGSDVGLAEYGGGLTWPAPAIISTQTIPRDMTSADVDQMSPALAHRRSARTGVLGSNGFGGFETVSNHGGAVGISLLSVPSSGARFVNV